MPVDDTSFIFGPLVGIFIATFLWITFDHIVERGRK